MRWLAPTSHLLQMRGLKRYDALNMPEYLGVASFTDAWIETETWSRTANLDAVASFTDAWIETTCEPPFRTASKSHLLQMRGLKPVLRPILPSTWCRIFYRCVD